MIIIATLLSKIDLATLMARDSMTALIATLPNKIVHFTVMVRDDRKAIMGTIVQISLHSPLGSFHMFDFHDPSFCALTSFYL